MNESTTAQQDAGPTLRYKLAAEWRYRKWDLQHTLNGWRDNFWMAIAWRLPHKLIMWATIRLIAHATTGKYENTIVPELTAMDALHRWDK